MPNSKYRPGGLITSVAQLANAEFIYFNNKLLHRGWFMSWQLRFAQRMVEENRLYRADRSVDDV